LLFGSILYCVARTLNCFALFVQQIKQSASDNGSSQSSGECTQESQDSLKPAVKKVKIDDCSRGTNNDEGFDGAVGLPPKPGECSPTKTTDATSVIDQSSGREVIELLDDDSDEPAETKDEDSEMVRVLRLSLQTANEEKARRTFSKSPLYKNLSRDDFQRCFDDWFNKQGGIEKIEKGTIVQEGNNWNDFKKGVSKDDMGNQERAQYGRLSIPALYQILDSLTGVSCELPQEAVRPINVFIDIGMGKYLCRFVLLTRSALFAHLLPTGIGVQVLQAAFVYGENT
jgi:hypothetical protein